VEKFFSQGRALRLPFDAIMLSGQPQGIAPTGHGHCYLKASAFEKAGRFFAFAGRCFIAKQYPAHKTHL